MNSKDCSKDCNRALVDTHSIYENVAETFPARTWDSAKEGKPSLGSELVFDVRDK